MERISTVGTGICDRAKCINCGEDHRATFKRCSKFAFNREVKREMAEGNVSAAEAVQRIKASLPELEGGKNNANIRRMINLNVCEKTNRIKSYAEATKSRVRSLEGDGRETQQLGLAAGEARPIYKPNDRSEYNFENEVWNAINKLEETINNLSSDIRRYTERMIKVLDEIKESIRSNASKCKIIEDGKGDQSGYLSVQHGPEAYYGILGDGKTKEKN